MLVGKLFSISLRSKMQYKASFLMVSAAHFIATFIDIVVIWVLFDRFKMVKGWTLFEVGVIYGIVHMGFALAEAFGRGFDQFDKMLKMGEFDQLLLRPVSPLLQIAASEIQVTKIGRFLQGAVVLIWSCSHLALSFFSFHTLLIFFSIVGTATLFYGLYVIQATLSFWTIETLEIMNITTYGGVSTAQYPMSIYNKIFRLLFTFLIPLACVAYYPLATLLQHETIPLWLATLAPMSGIVFLLLACQFWRFGVRHYCSSGS